jgi:hypothetical protein
MAKHKHYQTAAEEMLYGPCPGCQQEVTIANQPTDRPDDLRREVERSQCQRCDAPHDVDISIPSDVWNQIVERDSPGGDKYTTLCTLCIDDLLVEKGLTTTARFYFIGKALRSRAYVQEKPVGEQRPTPKEKLRAILMHQLDGMTKEEQHHVLSAAIVRFTKEADRE